ncbi:MAG: hypothetical protein ACFBRM_13210 [Pikeienuella sp.]
MPKRPLAGIAADVVVAAWRHQIAEEDGLRRRLSLTVQLTK